MYMLSEPDEDVSPSVNAKEVFPDANSAMVLRGFRGKMEWTQQELADKLWNHPRLHFRHGKRKAFHIQGNGRALGRGF